MKKVLLENFYQNLGGHRKTCGMFKCNYSTLWFLEKNAAFVVRIEKKSAVIYVKCLQLENSFLKR